jgi:hypothetical protein
MLRQQREFSPEFKNQLKWCAAEGCESEICGSFEVCNMEGSRMKRTQKNISHARK